MKQFSTGSVFLFNEQGRTRSLLKAKTWKVQYHMSLALYRAFYTLEKGRIRQQIWKAASSSDDSLHDEVLEPRSLVGFPALISALQA